MVSHNRANFLPLNLRPGGGRTSGRRRARAEEAILHQHEHIRLTSLANQLVECFLHLVAASGR